METSRHKNNELYVASRGKAKKKAIRKITRDYQKFGNLQIFEGFWQRPALRSEFLTTLKKAIRNMNECNINGLPSPAS
jgi:hypothetical protein